MKQITFRCACCKRIRTRNPRVKNQKYCGEKSCQQARKNKWQREKLKTDSDYRADKREIQQSWRARNFVVRMYLEEEYPAPMICKETGVGRSTISTWVRKYRLHGEEGLKSKQLIPRKKSRINKTVEKKIVDLKKDNPTYGPRRISDILKRFFFIKTSPTTVQKTLVSPM